MDICSRFPPAVRIPGITIKLARTDRRELRCKFRNLLRVAHGGVGTELESAALRENGSAELQMGAMPRAARPKKFKRTN